MRKKHKITAFVLLGVAALLAMALALQGSTFAVLDPAGAIAEEQRRLIVFATALCLVIVIPVFALTFGIVWRYHEGNDKSKYTPEWDHSRLAESIWWGVPLAIIAVLSVVIWQSSHALDPYKPLASDKKALEVQVIALDWKWLFLYPEQNIASVNFLQLPTDRPINFRITADAPMNSFWIPQLGGQVYAMAGMETKLHLIATREGDYRGSSANLSGEGFAGMNFTARAASNADFYKWVNEVKGEDKGLGMDAYKQLAKPSTDNPIVLYASYDSELFDNVINSYMSHGSEHDTSAVEHKLPDGTHIHADGAVHEAHTAEPAETKSEHGDHHE